MRPRTLSATSIESYLGCPARFAMETSGRISVDSEPGRFGTALHAALDRYIEVLYIEGTDEVAHNADLLAELWHEIGPTYVGLGSDYLEEGEELLDRWVETRDLPYEVVSREVKRNFEVVVPGFEDSDPQSVTFIMDRVDRDENGTYHVIDYKGLGLDTVIPTPSGWTTMRDLRVGDLVIGGDGAPCRVTGKSDVHMNPCFRIAFDDGSSLVADHEHRWLVTTDYGEKILTTEDLADNVVNPVTGQRHLRIPCVTAEFPAADLPIDPYVLGAWIGDGTAADGTITKPLPAMFTEIARRGYEVGKLLRGPDKCEAHTIFGLKGQLRELGVLNNKHIPTSYLRGSVEQRLDLLRGIMDTDGSWNTKRKRCVLTTTKEPYARDVARLVESLGWKATVFEVQGAGFGKTFTAWHTCFTPIDAEVFLARRPETYRPAGTVRGRRRMVRDVIAIPTVPTQCIQVDSPDHTFLAGEQMIRTHNSQYQILTPDGMRQLIQPALYALAVHGQYGVDEVVVTYDFLRSTPTSIVYNKRDLDRFKSYLKNTIAKIWADEDPKEKLNSKCIYCPRKAQCETLRRAADASWTPTLSLDELVTIRDASKNATKTLDTMVKEIDAVLLDRLRYEDLPNMEVQGYRYAAKRKSMSHYDPEVVLRILGDEAIPYLKVGKTALDKELDRRRGSRFSREQAAEIRELAASSLGEPYIEVTSLNPQDAE